MFKLAVTPFECLLVLRDDGHETRNPHSFMAPVSPGTGIRLEGRDWTVVEIENRLDDLPTVVCQPN